MCGGVPSLCIPVFSKRTVRPSIPAACRVVVVMPGLVKCLIPMFCYHVNEGCRNCPYLHPKRLLYFSIIYLCTFCQIC